jgi:hypothetical protein
VKQQVRKMLILTRSVKRHYAELGIMPTFVEKPLAGIRERDTAIGIIAEPPRAAGSHRWLSPIGAENCDALL